jgi:hypothetical protein
MKLKLNFEKFRQIMRNLVKSATSYIIEYGKYHFCLNSIMRPGVCWNFITIYGVLEPSCRTGPPAFLAWRAGTTSHSYSVPCPWAARNSQRSKPYEVGKYRPFHHSTNYAPLPVAAKMGRLPVRPGMLAISLYGRRRQGSQPA